MAVIKLRAESDELMRHLEALPSELLNAPPRVRQLALALFERASELVRVECRPAPGAAVTLLFKPSQRLLDLRAALRTGDFDRLVVKHAHGDASRRTHDD